MHLVPKEISEENPFPKEKTEVKIEKEQTKKKNQ